jgi:hypothetical protein
VKSSRQIRTTEISKRKQGCFLRSINTPIAFVIDVDKFAKLYVAIFSKAKRLAGNFQIVIESFSSEYDFKYLNENYEETRFENLYTCRYSDSRLKPFIDTLLLNGVKARLVMLLEPQWFITFVIASDSEIAHLITPFFSDVHRLSPKLLGKILSGKLINPFALKQLTIPSLPGIDEIQKQPLQVPSRYTLKHENAINIGKIMHPVSGEEIVDALLPLQRINQHVGIYATTGAGKTNLCHQIVLELNKHSIPCLIFDWKKDYRDLYKKKINAKVYGFTGDNLFSFNPLKPSGSPSQWVKELANIMAELLGGVYASGSFSVYVEILDKLYRDNGVYEGSTNYPNIFDLLVALESYSQRNLSERQRNWVASASKLLKSLSVGKTREAFSVREGLNLDELLSNTVVIELDGLGDQKAKAFLISALLQKIRNHRMKKQDRDILKHVIVIEEAQNCLAKNQEASSTVTTTYREIRSLCEGIICISQIPSELSKDAIANTNTFFIMKLVHRDDKLIASDILGIDDRSIENLSTGVCFMKADDVCLVKVPLVEKEIVNDSDIKTETRENVSTFAERKEITNRCSDLNPREWAVLKHIAESTAYNSSSLLAATNYSNREINSIIGTLINKGFVRYAYAKKQGVGRRQKIYFLFPYGEEAYKQQFGKHPDRRAAEHSHTDIKEKIIECLGPVQTRERFDIVVNDHAIEIETGSNNNQQILINIKKSLETFGKAFFVAAEQRVYNAILQQAGKHYFDSKQNFSINIALFDRFNEGWDVYEFKTNTSL